MTKTSQITSETEKFVIFWKTTGHSLLELCLSCCPRSLFANISHSFNRTFVAPLERLKLEYIVRGEQRHLFELVRSIAATQGLRGFWKGNLINILRTAPFKAVHFYAYDTYRKQLLRFSGNDETTHYERFIAGAAAGMTASVLCLPLDTVSATWTLS